MHLTRHQRQVAALIPKHVKVGSADCLVLGHDVTQPCLPLVIQGRVERWAPIGCVSRMSDVLNEPFGWQY